MLNNKPNVLITGACGLIGSALARSLESRYQVLGLDLHDHHNLPPGVEFLPADLTSEHSLDDAVDFVRLNYGTDLASVVHLAAYYDFSGEPSEKYDEVTVKGTERLLHVLQPFHVEQFVFSSSMLVHAPCEPGCKIREDSPLRPGWAYPKSKATTEELLRRVHGDTPLVVLRVAGVYDDRCHSIPIAHQIRRVYEQRMTGHLYPGDLAHGQAFLHLADLVDAVGRVVDRRAELPEETVLLLGEPETVPYGELQHRLGRLLHGTDWTTMNVPKPIARAGAWMRERLPWTGETFIKPWMIDRADDHYELDISRARERIGWEPEHRLGEALPGMIDELRRDPAAWYEENGLELPQKLRDATTSTVGG